MAGPSVPYAGNAANYPPNVNVLSGSDTPGSTTFNVTSEGALDRASFLLWSMSKAGQSYRIVQAVNGSGTPQLYKPAFDPGAGVLTAGVWLIAWAATLAGSWVTGVEWSYGADDKEGPGPGAVGGGHFVWNQVGGSSSPTTTDTTGVADVSVCGDTGTPGIVWIAALTVNNAQLQVLDSSYTAGSWTSKYTLSTVGSTVSSVEMAPIGSRVVVAVGGASGTALGVYSGGTAAAFAAVGSITATAGTKWSLKSNGTTLIVLPTFIRPTTPTLWTTTDGVTFTSVNISSIIPVGAFAAGLAWSSLQSLWYMAVQVSSTVTAFYSSPDGNTWTNVSSSPGPNLTIADFEVAGNALVLTTADTAIVTTNLDSLVFFSIDWGVNWRLASPAFQVNLSTGTTGYSRARIGSSPSRVLLGNSQQVRFSNTFGVPAHL